MLQRKLGPGSLILITGGAGFLGAAVAQRLLHDGLRVRVLDDFSRGRRDRLDGAEVEMVIGDVRSERAVREAMQGAAGIVHLAAPPPRPRTTREERHAHDVTVTGTWNVLAAARESGVTRVVVASSALVYGPRPPLPLHEEMTANPACPEGAHKLAAEGYVKLFAARDRMAACALRLFGVYGPGQDAGDDAPLVPRFCAMVIRGEPLTIHGDGSQTRDLVHVDDAASAFSAALAAPGVGGRIVNVGSGQAVSVRHLSSMITDLAGGVLPPPRYLPTHPGEPHDLRASLAAATSLLGYKPQVRLREGLEACLQALAPARPAPPLVAAPRRLPPPPPKPRAHGTPTHGLPAAEAPASTAVSTPPLFGAQPPSWELPDS